MNYSVIIPLYNRPVEIDELLDSLTKQSFRNFEVIVVEDGSTETSREIVNKYQNQLKIRYFEKPNEGPGLTRNYGAKRAKGDYFVFFDSDCIIPENYFESVNAILSKNYKDAYGGPDMAHKNFTPIQKAINYSMTSFLTTGGIRGRKSSLEKFHPRSFNMGISRSAFEKINGFNRMRFGEDIDLSIRLHKANFTSCLIKKAGVFHKRRTNLKQFFKQVLNSGIARYNLFKLHPSSLKLVHLLPALYIIGLIAVILLSVFVYQYILYPWFLFMAILSIHAFISTKNAYITLLIIITSQVQLFAYGIGFFYALFQGLILKKNVSKTFSKNLYK